MSFAEYSCKLFKPIFAYRQTVWTLIRLLKEQSDLGPHCLQKLLLKSQVDDKADDNCCDLMVNIKTGIEDAQTQLQIIVLPMNQEKKHNRPK